MHALALNTVVLNNNTRAPNDLSCIALTIDLAETGPGAEDLGISNLDEVDLVLGAESLDELDVFGLSAGLNQDGKMGLALVKGLGTLAKTTSKTVMDESILQHLLIKIVRSMRGSLAERG